MEVKGTEIELGEFFSNFPRNDLQQRKKEISWLWYFVEFYEVDNFYTVDAYDKQNERNTNLVPETLDLSASIINSSQW